MCSTNCYPRKMNCCPEPSNIIYTSSNYSCSTTCQPMCYSCQPVCPPCQPPIRLDLTAEPKSYVQLGQSITFFYTLTNQSFYPIEGVATVSDNYTGSQTFPICLEPQSSRTFSRSHIISIIDMNTGQIVNSACAKIEGCCLPCPPPCPIPCYKPVCMKDLQYDEPVICDNSSSDSSYRNYKKKHHKKSNKRFCDVSDSSSKSNYCEKKQSKPQKCSFVTSPSVVTLTRIV